MFAIRKGNTITIAPLEDALVGLQSGWAIRFADKPQFLFRISRKNLDGSRDVFGKLCSYLDANPQAQEQLKASVSRSSTQTSSPELMRALSTLLKNTPRHDRSADQRDATKHDGANNTKETNNEPPTEGN
jgi:hypothetical protein